jgi:hypothetical protein
MLGTMACYVVQSVEILNAYSAGRSSCSCGSLHASSWCQLGWTLCHRYCSCRSAQTPLDPSGGFSYDVTNMAAIVNSCFWLADFYKSSPLKPLGQMNRNLVGSIYGRFSIKIAHFVPIRKQTWPPQGILVSDWLISIKSSPLKPLGQMNRNLVGSTLGRFSINFYHLVPIR